MSYTAKHNHARIAPRKARLVMDLIRGRTAEDAINLLQFSKKRASVMIARVIKSAIANYNDQETAPSREALFVSEARVDPGKTMKRFQPKDRGKSYSIMKRTSHLIVSIDASVPDDETDDQTDDVTGEAVTGEKVTGKKVTGRKVTGSTVTGKKVSVKKVTGKRVTGELAAAKA